LVLQDTYRGLHFLSGQSAKPSVISKESFKWYRQYTSNKISTSYLSQMCRKRAHYTEQSEVPLMPRTWCTDCVCVCVCGGGGCLFFSIRYVSCCCWPAYYVFKWKHQYM
jgi:NAD kinase